MHCKIGSYTHAELMNARTHIQTQDRMVIGRFSMHLRAESITKATISNDRDIICFVYHSSTTEANVRIATSLISADQAKVNLDRELDPVSMIALF